MKKELLSISLALLLLMPIGLTDNSLGNDIALSNCAPIPVGISYWRMFYFNSVCEESTYSEQLPGWGVLTPREYYERYNNGRWTDSRN